MLASSLLAADHEQATKRSKSKGKAQKAEAVHLVARRRRYLCAGCGRTCLTPWPLDVLADSKRGRERRFTKRCALALLRRWSEGAPFTELGRWVRADAEHLSRLIKVWGRQLRQQATSRMPLPLVIGIDEIFLWRKYYTVVNDLSRPGQAFLISILPYRPGGRGASGSRRRASQDDERSLEAHLTDELEELMLHYTKVRAPDGRRACFPVVVTDGWSAFASAAAVAHSRATPRTEAGVPHGTFAHVLDRFHLVKRFESAAHLELRRTAGRYGRLRQRVDALEGIGHAIEGATSSREFKELHADLMRQRGAIESVVNDGRRDALTVFAAPLPLHVLSTRDMEMEDVKAACRRAVCDEVRALRTRIDAAQRTVEREINRARTAGLAMVRLTGCVDRRILCWDDLEAEFDRHMCAWARAMETIDHQFGAREQHERFTLATLDRALRVSTNVPEWQFPTSENPDLCEIPRREGRLALALRTALETRVITVRDTALEWLSEAERRDARSLLDRYRPIERAVVILSVLEPEEKDDLASLLTLIEQTPAGCTPPATICAPCNAVTEARNARMRRILSRLTHPPSHEDLRGRLLMSMGAPVFRVPAATGAPVELTEAPPDRCPACGAAPLRTTTDTVTSMVRDVPIGDLPTVYRVRVTEWRCPHCRKRAPRNDERATRSAALDAYLTERLSTEPPPSLASLHCTTGVHRGVLKGVLADVQRQRQHAPAVVRSSREPARVIALYLRRSRALPSGEHQVCLVDVRHDPPSAASLLPARLLDARVMRSSELLDRLSELHQQQRSHGRLHVVLGPSALWLLPLLDSAAAGRWRSVIEPHTVLAALQRGFNRLLELWFNGTKPLVIKDARVHANRVRQDISDDERDATYAALRKRCSVRVPESFADDAARVRALLDPTPFGEQAHFTKMALRVDDILSVWAYLKAITASIRPVSNDPLAWQAALDAARQHAPTGVTNAALDGIAAAARQVSVAYGDALTNAIPDAGERDPAPNSKTGRYHAVLAVRSGLITSAWRALPAHHAVPPR